MKNRILWSVAVVGLAAVACGSGSQGRASAPTGEATAAPTAGSQAVTGPGTITVEGDIQRSYRPSEAMGLMILDRLNVALFEDDQVSGVVLQFDSNLAPGTYDINDHWTNPVVDVFGEYDSYHDSDVDIYLSTGGTLNLTQTGDSFSGSFTYTAALTGDASRVITVEGSFEGVSPSS